MLSSNKFWMCHEIISGIIEQDSMYYSEALDKTVSRLFR